MTGSGWAHSGRMRCLEFEWSIVANDSALVERTTSLYEGCADGRPGPARHVFMLRRHADESVSVYRDGVAALRRAPAALALARLAWEINRGVVQEAGKQLLLHAAAAALDERVVVLAGPEGSGKSTLVAALVCSGLQYVTDETVAVEPSGAIAPYPKPIALPHASLRALRELWPDFPVSTCAPGIEGLVSPQMIGAAVARPGGVARLVVLLSAFRPGRTTAARQISRAEAAVTLGDQAFNLREIGPGRVDLLADAVRKSDCYRLDVGDLDDARRLVVELLDRASGDR